MHEPGGVRIGDAFTSSGILGPSIAFRKWWTVAAQGPFGTHRGDMLQDVPAARMSARKWADEIRRRVGPREAIYLCTDDDAFARDVVSRLGDFRILRLEKQAQPIDQAFIEFLCLSRATRVVGTVMSSFSQELARFSGIQFEFCRSRGHELLGTSCLLCDGPRSGHLSPKCTFAAEPRLTFEPY